MRLRRLLAAGALVAAIGTLPGIEAEAHGGTSFCDSSFNVGHAPTGAHEGTCSTTFQGSPFGVIAVYEATDPDVPAEIHIELWLKVGSTKKKIAGAECSAGEAGDLTGRAACAAESNGEFQRAFELPEPLPADAIVTCTAHSGHGSHSELPAGVTALVRFGCYSTDAAEAALRDDMDDHTTLPPAPADPEPEPTPNPVPGGGAPDGAPAVVLSVLPGLDAYTPSQTVMAQGSSLTYVNADTNVPHDVVASDRTPASADRSWCTTIPNFAVSCPIFWSELIVGGPGSTTPVLGAESLPPGDYEFYCTIHQSMLGTLTVVA